MEIIDLTLELFDGLKTYEKLPNIKVEEHATFENTREEYKEPCEGFESRMLSFSDHSGTHIDAPLHFIRDGNATSEMDLNRVIGKALLIDVSNCKLPDKPVTKQMLQKAMEQQGINVSKNDIVLVRTRKGEWGDKDFFNEKSFAKCTADWFIDKKVKMVGLDLPNIDLNDNMQRDVHMAMLGREMYIIENLINLDKLPKDKSFWFSAIPLKIRNGTASPVRAIAVL